MSSCVHKIEYWTHSELFVGQKGSSNSKNTFSSVPKAIFSIAFILSTGSSGVKRVSWRALRTPRDAVKITKSVKYSEPSAQVTKGFSWFHWIFFTVLFNWILLSMSRDSDGFGSFFFNLKKAVKAFKTLPNFRLNSPKYSQKLSQILFPSKSATDFRRHHQFQQTNAHSSHTSFLIPCNCSLHCGKSLRIVLTNSKELRQSLNLASFANISCRRIRRVKSQTLPFHRTKSQEFQKLSSTAFHNVFEQLVDCLTGENTDKRRHILCHRNQSHRWSIRRSSFLLAREPIGRPCRSFHFEKERCESFHQSGFLLQELQNLQFRFQEASPLLNILKALRQR